MNVRISVCALVCHSPQLNLWISSGLGEGTGCTVIRGERTLVMIASYFLYCFPIFHFSLSPKNPAFLHSLRSLALISL